ncbi:hypothetical protein TNIN_86561 [Trichonephila inaurata madagascariensis]|uniref:Uncharacterized protein n=1 Tax=Trichonephila inaurata madagascariensis TaxID=2747483 RepID=A0A8X6XFK4_9ARAC|nr:hypothetical protein TNIN_86561 [Trichonephila inaurata madagascariensis]
MLEPSGLKDGNIQNPFREILSIRRGAIAFEIVINEKEKSLLLKDSILLTDEEVLGPDEKTCKKDLFDD